jgi:AraC-like DNA-binding protein
MREILAQAIRQTERGLLRFKVPREEGLMQKLRGCHFHFKPEIFIQVRGRTDFHFPREEFSLLPGEMVVIPTGVPHGETIFTDEKGPFRNLVVGFYSNILSLHLAHEASPQRPDIEVIEFFEASNQDVLITLTNTLVQTYHMKAPARDQVLKGLLMALLGLLQNLVETGAGELNTDMGKVFQVKWLVRDQFSNSELNVKGIAERLQCSPDYLSHLFHRETGEKLIQYIHRVRIEGAVMALETTPLHVSEIAYASGFADPAYFARVFKKQKGESPQEYRARLDAKRMERETNPKTIYFDHVDYTHGPDAVVNEVE